MNFTLIAMLFRAYLIVTLFHDLGLKDQFKPEELHPQTALLLLTLIFALAAVSLTFVYSSFPEMEQAEVQYVKFPQVIFSEII